MSFTARPASRSAFAVPPVEISSTPNPAALAQIPPAPSCRSHSKARGEWSSRLFHFDPLPNSRFCSLFRFSFKNPHRLARPPSAIARRPNSRLHRETRLPVKVSADQKTRNNSPCRYSSTAAASSRECFRVVIWEVIPRPPNRRFFLPSAILLRPRGGGVLRGPPPLPRMCFWELIAPYLWPWWRAAPAYGCRLSTN